MDSECRGFFNGDDNMLKGRLKLLYDMIPPCHILSDIGTDHALLPAYALMTGKCKKAIASDINKGPLERAQRTLMQFGLENSMELRLGNGLKPISEDEADCIVIAGMGGHLITEILLDSLNVAKRAKNIIIQPMTKQEIVRPFLWRHGFEILDEDLVREDNKIYQALRIRYTGVVRENWSHINEVIGEILVKKNNPLVLDWVREHRNRQANVVKGLMSAKEPDKSLEKESELLKEMELMLKELENREEP